MVRAGVILAMLAVLVAVAGCSIFDLKTPEPPIIGPGTDDPFNFGDILRIANESAADMDYRDYFKNDVRFVDYALRNMDGRDNVINMLNRLRPQVSLIEWQVESGEKIIGNNQQIVNNVPYIVYTTRGETYSGTADFHIVRDTDWTISYWKDAPYGSTPFFDP